MGIERDYLYVFGRPFESIGQITFKIENIINQMHYKKNLIKVSKNCIFYV